ncbi:MAG: type II toxin-antitoxin system RelE/ParE family toxin [Saprospiraceae bacterium]
MLKLLIKPEAENDLEKIYQYTFENWGIEQAEKYQDELYEGMQMISKRPNIGKVYPYSIEEYRKLHVNRHLIFYRFNAHKCEIIRILHDSMDIKMNLESSGT